MDEVIETGIGNERLTMVLLMGFAALALLMAAIGVFGVTSYSVSQRTHELGVRMALGANPSSVLALVVRQEMGACLIGIVAGVIGAVFLSSLLDSLLFGVAPRDTMTLSVAAGVLLDRHGDRLSHPRAPRHARRSGDGAAAGVEASLQTRLSQYDRA